ncbi:XdhC family protein [Streptomyces sp. NPDC001193]
MLDIAEELRAWCAAHREFALATVVAVTGSAPRGPGASLAVDAGGTALGSVSGGCVESAVHELCLDAITSGEGGVHRFGYSDDDAFAIGLTCGVSGRPGTVGTDRPPPHPRYHRYGPDGRGHARSAVAERHQAAARATAAPVRDVGRAALRRAGTPPGLVTSGPCRALPRL